mmetsp:Transcript_112010/g.205578  ORF Transcript_112010/g.205578 Transcript_112010/m.205578 type:complete len:213 (+) Transcript_112010:437-1075(+)
MRLLRLLRCRGYAGANGPHWLIRNDNLIRIHQPLDLLHLRNAHGHGCVHAFLALRQFLTNGEDTLHPSIKDVLQLGGQHCIIFFEVLTTLRVANQDPFNTHVFHLLNGHLTSECTTALEVTILRANGCTICELARAVRDVEWRRAYVDIACACITCIDVCNQSIELLHFVWVALPVSTDDWLAGHGDCVKGMAEMLGFRQRLRQNLPENKAA